MVNVKNIVLGLGIIIVFALALWQGIEAFYPSPEYGDFCKESKFITPASVGKFTECNFTGQLSMEEQICYTDNGRPIYNYNDKGCPVSIKECDYCQRDYDSAQDNHSKYVFFIALIIGIIVIIVGYSVLSLEPVGSALMGSGIWAFFYGTVVNWRNFSNIWRFLLLFVALILLVWVAYRLNKNVSTGKKSGRRKI